MEDAYASLLAHLKRVTGNGFEFLTEVVTEVTRAPATAYIPYPADLTGEDVWGQVIQPRDDVSGAGRMALVCWYATWVKAHAELNVTAVVADGDLASYFHPIRAAALYFGWVDMSGTGESVADTTTAWPLTAISAETIETATRWVSMFPVVIKLAHARAANYWDFNHAIGNRQVQGALLKVCQVLHSGRKPDATSAYNLVHPLSARNILSSLGKTHGTQSAKYAAVAGGTLATPTDDMIARRLSKPPAGTSTLTIAQAYAYILAPYGLLTICGLRADVTEIKRVAALIATNPAAYHIGANYLCHDKAIVVTARRNLGGFTFNGGHISRICSVGFAFLSVVAPGHSLLAAPSARALISEALPVAALARDVAAEVIKPAGAEVIRAIIDAARSNSEAVRALEAAGDAGARAAAVAAIVTNDVELAK